MLLIVLESKPAYNEIEPDLSGKRLAGQFIGAPNLIRSYRKMIYA